MLEQKIVSENRQYRRYELYWGTKSLLGRNCLKITCYVGIYYENCSVGKILRDFNFPLPHVFEYTCESIPALGINSLVCLILEFGIRTSKKRQILTSSDASR